ncbi:MAG: NRDE family protein [Halioglobus sp.]|nr:NRDE family protein [Halioglobus sp.]
MCLLIFAHQVSPQYPLVVAANRDEFHARPTAVSAFWAEYPYLFAGKDLEQGGTWMGATRGGRFAAITNYSDPAHTVIAPRSRGELPLNYLTGTDTPKSFLDKLATHARSYAGFSLLIGNRGELWYFTNSDTLDPWCLPPGVYGLSNASLDTPWPKVERGKAQLQRLLRKDDIEHASLFGVVADRRLAEQGTARDQNPGDSMEAILSAQFIVTEHYGTRSSTTMWRDAQGLISWREESFNAQGIQREVAEVTF